MKLVHATFHFNDNGLKYEVIFIPDLVRIFVNDKMAKEIQNPKKEWKPCVTHCLFLIKYRLTGGPLIPKTPERVVAKKEPVWLKVFADGE